MKIHGGEKSDDSADTIRLSRISREISLLDLKAFSFPHDSGHGERMSDKRKRSSRAKLGIELEASKSLCLFHIHHMGSWPGG